MQRNILQGVRIGALLLLLTGCDYAVPLVEKAELAVDATVTGLWGRRGDDGRMERLLVLPINERECLVAYPAGRENALFARACLWQDEGLTLVQLDWIGSAQGQKMEEPRRYQYASFTVQADVLSARLLNADVVARDAADAGALQASLAQNRENPALFREEWVFRRVVSVAD